MTFRVSTVVKASNTIDVVGKAPSDDLYDGQARRMVQGRRLLMKRRGLWTSP